MEKLFRSRISVQTLPPFEYIVGLVCLLLATVLVLPIPLGNLLPALSISQLAHGLLEHDGYTIVTGLVAATVFVVVVLAVICGVIKGIIS